MSTTSDVQQYRPHDLLAEMTRVLNDYREPGGRAFHVVPTSNGPDSWTVEADVTVTGPGGFARRLRVRVSDTHRGVAGSDGEG